MKRKKPKDDWQPRPIYAWDSPEAKAIKMLHLVVDRMQAFYAVWRRKEDGSVSFRMDMTPQLLAFAETGDASTWVTLNRQQAYAWEELLRKWFDAALPRRRFKEGARAPWPWPPSLEGKIYTDPGGVPPMSDADYAAIANEGQG